MKVTQELARELWDQAPHNWNDFRQTLQSDHRRLGNLDTETRERLERLAQTMELEGNGFPHSSDDLYHLLANRLGVSEPIS
ncbi:MAG TPA: hypothetical protein VFB58_03785 [Chloroflexota bacterium]|nr:hypothetical protein [Chloroflexota bacterium]